LTETKDYTAGKSTKCKKCDNDMKTGQYLWPLYPKQYIMALLFRKVSYMCLLEGRIFVKLKSVKRLFGCFILYLLKAVT
jgi:hypothetical protein